MNITPVVQTILQISLPNIQELIKSKAVPAIKRKAYQIVDKKADSKYDYEHISLKQSLLIGISQALAAAFPGVSRSGITMTVARSLKLDRESAAKFSFLLGTPIIAAAVLVNIKDFAFSIPFFLGIFASFVAGLLVIKFLMDYLKKGNFKIFAIYRIIFGIIILGLLFIR